MEKGQTELLTGAQILIETLIEQGVSDVFGYPGAQIIDIYDELYKSAKRINHIITAHEQGAAHAADGYARSTGKVGVVIATSGPGATNLVTGIATAMMDSVPMVAITGNVATNLIGKDSFQEIDITGVTLPITKHNYVVKNVSELADTVREAFRIAKSGRPGPVLIDIPKDVQISTFEFTKGDIVSPFPQKNSPDSHIGRAIELINASKRPYIYIGGGASNAEMTDDIIAFADKIDAYIGSTFMGLSVVPHSHKRFLGMQGMHGKYASSMANKEADLIIGIGVRFSDRATGDPSKYCSKTKIIQIDADLSEINKNVKVDVGLVGDIKLILSKILKHCEKTERAEWREKVDGLKIEGKKLESLSEPSIGKGITPKKIFDIINGLKDKNTIVSTDVGQHQMWTAQYARFEMPRHFVSSGGLGTMGFGMGASIGSYIGTGDRVVLITGDGSFGMNLNELVTAVTYKVPMIIVIMNNGVLGMVRQWQKLFYDGRYSSTTLNRKTDFIKVAEGFGAKGARAGNVEEFKKAFERAKCYKGPFVIDTVINTDELVLPMLPPGGSIDEIIINVNEDCD